MDYEWDLGKSEANRARRGFGFEVAVTIFAGRLIEIVDDRRDYGEVRVLAIGEANGRVLAVIYTDRGEVRRIISARMANRKERQAWQSRA